MNTITAKAAFNQQGYNITTGAQNTTTMVNNGCDVMSPLYIRFPIVWENYVDITWGRQIYDGTRPLKFELKVTAIPHYCYERILSSTTCRFRLLGLQPGTDYCVQVRYFAVDITNHQQMNPIDQGDMKSVVMGNSNGKKTEAEQMIQEYWTPWSCAYVTTLSSVVVKPMTAGQDFIHGEFVISDRPLQQGIGAAENIDEEGKTLVINNNNNNMLLSSVIPAAAGAVAVVIGDAAYGDITSASEINGISFNESSPIHVYLPIKEFQVEVSERTARFLQGTKIREKIVPVDELHHDFFILELSPNRIFYARARAVSVHGEPGEWSESVQFATIMPVNVLLAEVGETYAIVSWQRERYFGQPGESRSNGTSGCLNNVNKNSINNDIQLLVFDADNFIQEDFSKIAQLVLQLYILPSQRDIDIHYGEKDAEFVFTPKLVMEETFPNEYHVYRLKDLLPGRQYFIRTKYLNMSGNWSGWTETPFTTFFSVAIPEVVLIGNNFIQVNWRREYDGPRAVTHEDMINGVAEWELRCAVGPDDNSGEGASTSMRFPASEIMTKMVNMRSSVEYVIDVRARVDGSEEWGPWSSPVRAQTLSGLKPRYKSLGETWIEASWGLVREEEVEERKHKRNGHISQQQNRNNIQNTISRYHVMLSSISSTFRVAKYFPPEVTSYIFQDLKPGMSFHLVAQAFSDNRWGDWSDPPALISTCDACIPRLLKRGEDFIEFKWDCDYYLRNKEYFSHYEETDSEGISGSEEGMRNKGKDATSKSTNKKGKSESCPAPRFQVRIVRPDLRASDERTTCLTCFNASQHGTSVPPEEESVFELTGTRSSYRVDDVPAYSRVIVQMRCFDYHMKMWGGWGEEASFRTLPFVVTVTRIAETVVDVSWTAKPNIFSLFVDGVDFAYGDDKKKLVYDKLAPIHPTRFILRLLTAKAGLSLKGRLEEVGTYHFDENQSRFFSFTNLQPDTLYACQLCYYDNDEWSSYSAPLRFATAPPLEVRTLGVAEDHVSIRWGRWAQRDVRHRGRRTGSVKRQRKNNNIIDDNEIEKWEENDEEVITLEEIPVDEKYFRIIVEDMTLSSTQQNRSLPYPSGGLNIGNETTKPSGVFPVLQFTVENATNYTLEGLRASTLYRVTVSASLSLHAPHGTWSDPIYLYTSSGVKLSLDNVGDNFCILSWCTLKPLNLKKEFPQCRLVSASSLNAGTDGSGKLLSIRKNKGVKGDMHSSKINDEDLLINESYNPLNGNVIYVGDNSVQEYHLQLFELLSDEEEGNDGSVIYPKKKKDSSSNGAHIFFDSIIQSFVHTITIPDLTSATTYRAQICACSTVGTWGSWCPRPPLEFETLIPSSIWVVDISSKGIMLVWKGGEYDVEKKETVAKRQLRIEMMGQDGALSVGDDEERQIKIINFDPEEDHYLLQGLETNLTYAVSIRSLPSNLHDGEEPFFSAPIYLVLKEACLTARQCGETWAEVCWRNTFAPTNYPKAQIITLIEKKSEEKDGGATSRGAISTTSLIDTKAQSHMFNGLKANSLYAAHLVTVEQRMRPVTNFEESLSLKEGDEGLEIQAKDLEEVGGMERGEPLFSIPLLCKGALGRGGLGFQMGKDREGAGTDVRRKDGLVVFRTEKGLEMWVEFFGQNFVCLRWKAGGRSDGGETLPLIHDSHYEIEVRKHTLEEGNREGYDYETEKRGEQTNYNDDESPLIKPVSGSMAVVKDLIPGATYSFRIRAIPSSDCEEVINVDQWSEPAVVIMMDPVGSGDEDGDGSRGLVIKVADLGEHHITFQWKYKPRTLEGTTASFRQTVTYEVRLINGDVKKEGDESCSPSSTVEQAETSETERTFKNLACGILYKFQVRPIIRLTFGALFGSHTEVIPASWNDPPFKCATLSPVFACAVNVTESTALLCWMRKGYEFPVSVGVYEDEKSEFSDTLGGIDGGKVIDVLPFKGKSSTRTSHVDIEMGMKGITAVHVRVYCKRSNSKSSSSTLAARAVGQGGKQSECSINRGEEVHGKTTFSALPSPPPPFTAVLMDKCFNASQKETYDEFIRRYTRITNLIPGAIYAVSVRVLIAATQTWGFWCDPCRFRTSMPCEVSIKTVLSSFIAVEWNRQKLPAIYLNDLEREMEKDVAKLSREEKALKIFRPAVLDAWEVRFHALAEEDLIDEEEEGVGDEEEGGMDETRENVDENSFEKKITQKNNNATNGVNNDSDNDSFSGDPLEENEEKKRNSHHDLKRPPLKSFSVLVNALYSKYCISGVISNTLYAVSVRARYTHEVGVWSKSHYILTGSGLNVRVSKIGLSFATFLWEREAPMTVDDCVRKGARMGVGGMIEQTEEGTSSPALLSASGCRHAVEMKRKLQVLQNNLEALMEEKETMRSPQKGREGGETMENSDIVLGKVTSLPRARNEKNMGEEETFPLGLDELIAQSSPRARSSLREGGSARRSGSRASPERQRESSGMPTNKDKQKKKIGGEDPKKKRLLSANTIRTQISALNAQMEEELFVAQMHFAAIKSKTVHCDGDYVRFQLRVRPLMMVDAHDSDNENSLAQMDDVEDGIGLNNNNHHNNMPTGNEISSIHNENDEIIVDLDKALNAVCVTKLQSGMQYESSLRTLCNNGVDFADYYVVSVESCSQMHENDSLDGCLFVDEQKNKVQSGDVFLGKTETSSPAGQMQQGQQTVQSKKAGSVTKSNKTFSDLLKGGKEELMTNMPLAQPKSFTSANDTSFCVDREKDQERKKSTKIRCRPRSAFLPKSWRTFNLKDCHVSAATAYPDTEGHIPWSAWSTPSVQFSTLVPTTARILSIGSHSLYLLWDIGSTIIKPENDGDISNENIENVSTPTSASGENNDNYNKRDHQLSPIDTSEGETSNVRNRNEGQDEDRKRSMSSPKTTSLPGRVQMSSRTTSHKRELKKDLSIATAVSGDSKSAAAIFGPSVAASDVTTGAQPKKDRIDDEMTRQERQRSAVVMFHVQITEPIDGGGSSRIIMSTDFSDAALRDALIDGIGLSVGRGAALGNTEAEANIIHPPILQPNTLYFVSVQTCYCRGDAPLADEVNGALYLNQLTTSKWVKEDDELDSWSTPIAFMTMPRLEARLQSAAEKELQFVVWREAQSLPPTSLIMSLFSGSSSLSPSSSPLLAASNIVIWRPPVSNHRLYVNETSCVQNFSLEAGSSILITLDFLTVDTLYRISTSDRVGGPAYWQSLYPLLIAETLSAIPRRPRLLGRRGEATVITWDHVRHLSDAQYIYKIEMAIKQKDGKQQCSPTAQAQQQLLSPAPMPQQSFSIETNPVDVITNLKHGAFQLLGYTEVNEFRLVDFDIPLHHCYFRVQCCKSRQTYTGIPCPVYRTNPNDPQSIFVTNAEVYIWSRYSATGQFRAPSMPEKVVGLRITRLTHNSCRLHWERSANWKGNGIPFVHKVYLNNNHLDRFTCVAETTNNWLDLVDLVTNCHYRAYVSANSTMGSSKNNSVLYFSTRPIPDDEAVSTMLKGSMGGLSAHLTSGANALLSPDASKGKVVSGGRIAFCRSLRYFDPPNSTLAPRTVLRATEAAVVVARAKIAKETSQFAPLLDDTAASVIATQQKWQRMSLARSGERSPPFLSSPYRNQKGGGDEPHAQDGYLEELTGGSGKPKYLPPLDS